MSSLPSTKNPGPEDNYARDIDAVTASLPEGADYRLLDLQPGNIVVDGQVSDPFDVLKFNEALEASPLFSSARVSQLQSDGEPTGASFKVIIDGE
jgi:hypothetical protein